MRCPTCKARMPKMNLPNGYIRRCPAGHYTLHSFALNRRTTSVGLVHYPKQQRSAA